MTDSESDTSNNVFTFQNVNTTVSAKGPSTNITNLSFRNQLTSTMYMPRNFERQRYAESSYDQRSMYYRRETSPMSIHSACDIRPRNFQQYYPGMSSQQSMFNGRSGSPMSMRSIDSNASVSAADIAFAFKNVKFNKYDLKVIKDAYHKLMKQRVRKRIEKRRNLRLFLKGNRRRSGDDSGEQGSNSSISSDDCRSVKTSYKENMSSGKSARIDLTDLRKTVRENNMLKDQSENFRQNTFKNMFSVGSGSVHLTQKSNNTLIPKQINPVPTQKDRFRNGFLLPSQRFNRSVASSAIPENTEKCHKNMRNNELNSVKNRYPPNNYNKNKNCASGSEEEEIFSEVTVREKSMYATKSQGKRGLNSDDDSSLPDKKKCKMSSPINIQNNKKGFSKQTNVSVSNNNIENFKQFEFAKPTLPVRKSKSKIQEKLIAKSAQSLADFLEPVPNKVQNNVELLQPSEVQQKSNNNQTQLEQSETTQNSDISMRPSFIKRKLFTQNLDVAEKANLSSDSTNSPQSNVYPLQKEKNKARKLVTNQSCLNREVQDDSNLLDLIHRIVPPDRINGTNQSSINQTKIDVNNKNKKDGEDKWDVTSVISMCNEDDLSDTYTDDEIFEGDVSKKGIQINKGNSSKTNMKTTNKDIIDNKPKPRVCKIVVQKLANSYTLQKQIDNQDINLAHNNVTKNCAKSSAKSFWDTDFESDAECQTALPRSSVITHLKKANATSEATKQDFKNPAGNARSGVSEKFNQFPDASKQLNNTTINNIVMNSTIDSMRKFNTSNLSVRSHRTAVKKKCFNETCVQETKNKLNSQNKMFVDKKKNNSHESNKQTVEKHSNTDIQIKNTLEIPKSKLNIQNENCAIKRATSQTRKNCPKDKKKPSKQVESPETKYKSESKSMPEKSSEGVSNKLKSKPERQNKSSAENRVKKQRESTNYKKQRNCNAQNDNKKSKKDTQNKSPDIKSKSKSDRQNSSVVKPKKSNAVSQPTKSNINNTVEFIPKSATSGRPIRSCRTSSQNRSVDLSRSSQFNNTSDRSLRSRVINLSSSIENITIKIKPRNKPINNKNISQINTRKSDVSFSLGSDKQTPTPKKSLTRSRANFFKGKRKT